MATDYFSATPQMKVALHNFCHVKREKLLQGKDHLFIDNESNILAIAHTDWVQPPKKRTSVTIHSTRKFSHTLYTNKHIGEVTKILPRNYNYKDWTLEYIYEDVKDTKPKLKKKKKEKPEEKFYSKGYEVGSNLEGVICRALDDRLGVFMILYMLPLMEINVDILLTDNEEVGASTAQNFVLPEGKEYNWIVGFDRRGTDAVMYNYSRDEGWRGALSKHFTIGHGSCSDISKLYDMGVSAFNMGVGFYNEHTAGCYMTWNACISQLKAFKEFHEEYKDTKFIHDNIPVKHIASASTQPWCGYGYGGGYNDPDYYSGESEDMGINYIDKVGEWTMPDTRMYHECHLCGVSNANEDLVEVNLFGETVYLCPGCETDILHLTNFGCCDMCYNTSEELHALIDNKFIMHLCPECLKKFEEGDIDYERLEGTEENSSTTTEGEQKLLTGGDSGEPTQPSLLDSGEDSIDGHEGAG